MADDNQNTEMEDILSSIKNILEGDGNNQPATDILPKEADVVDDLLNTAPEVDDILELSPDMRVEQTAEQPSAEEESVDVSLPELENEIADSINIGIEDETSDSVFEETMDIGTEIEQPLDMDFEQISEIVSDGEASDVTENDTDTDMNEQTLAEHLLSVEDLEISTLGNIEENERDVIIEPVSFNNAENLSETSLDEQIDAAPVIETEIAPLSAGLPLEEEPAVDTIVEKTINDAPAVEEIAEQQVITEAVVEEPSITEVSIEVPTTTEVVVEEVATDENISAETANEVAKPDAADVSAGIISNFAKMFAREEATPVVSAPLTDENTNITAIGNTGKTLEEFVLEAISKVIGKEISQQWNNGAEFKTLAEAEINRQTREWINDNLPALVEKVVKQEIERVIAKVGS